MQNYVKESSHLVMPGNLNAANKLFGGTLIQWVDEAAAMFVMGVLETPMVVTKKISEITFNEPARQGDALEFFFCVDALGTTSITVSCQVKTKVIDPRERPRTIVECNLVFVKINRDGRPEPHGRTMPLV